MEAAGHARVPGVAAAQAVRCDGQSLRAIAMSVGLRGTISRTLGDVRATAEAQHQDE